MGSSVLECDLGNTRCKWRVLVDGEVAARGEAEYERGFAGLGDVLPPDRICVACVASDTVRDAFLAAIEPLGVAPVFARPQVRAAGVDNAYGADYARLGVDRWLAVVAAWKRVGGAVLVLDAGSALTADLVDGSGVHVGGYIVPGERMMRGALLQATGKVRFEPGAAVAGLDFGCNTADAVGGGVLAAQVGAAQVAIQQAERQIAARFAILVTGGAGQRLLHYLPAGAELVPDLVLDGLKWVVPEGQ